jgi:hypothetical protein
VCTGRGRISDVFYTFDELLKNNLVEARWGSGKFVGAKLTKETEKNIRNWLKENSVDALGCEDLHVTVILDKKRKFPWDLMKYEPPVEVPTDSFALDLFGPEKNVLVLKFDNKFLEDRHYAARKELGIKWDYDSYHPHLALSYSFKGDLSKLSLPTFPLFLDHEYTKPFKDPGASLKD